MAEAPCPIDGCDLKRTRRASYEGPTYATLKWIYTTEEELNHAGFIIGKDDIIYTFTKSGEVYAIYPNGTLKWKSSIGSGTFYGVTLSEDNTLYTSFKDGVMYALDATDGSIDWIYSVPSTAFMEASPTIWSDGTVYIPDSYGYLNALNPDGTMKWRTMSSPGTSPGGPGRYIGGAVIGDDENIYVGKSRLNMGGVVEWTWALGHDLCGLSIGPDGNLYSPYPARAVNKDNGTIIWTSSRYSYQWGRTRVGIDTDGTIFFNQRTPSYQLVALNTDGTEKWASDISGSGSGGPSVGINNLVYFSNGFTLTKSGDFKWRYSMNSSQIGSDGTLYGFYYNSYYIYAFQPWTLTATVNPSGIYTVGETATFRITTSMLATDPVSGEANQVQVLFEDGTTLPLTYQSTNSDGNTVWTATWEVPERDRKSEIGTHTVTIEASAVNVETDTTTHFPSPPTNSNNTGITTTTTYTITSRAIIPSPESATPPSPFVSVPTPTPTTTPTPTSTITKEEEIIEEGIKKPISKMTVEELKAEVLRITNLIKELQTQLTELLGTSQIQGIPSDFSFQQDLQFEMINTDVKYLQIILNSSPDTRLADSGSGSPNQETNYFGPLTKEAVIKFQEKYSSEILTPWKLIQGTGFVGKTTRDKLNNLLAK